MTTSQSQSQLEVLSAELKLQVLYSLPSVSSLNALTHSSPHFFNVYHDREQAQILAQVLENELGREVLKDVWYVIRAARHIKLRGVGPFGDKLEYKSRKILSELLRSGKGLDKSELGITLDDMIWFSKKLPALQEVSIAFFENTIGNHPITGERIPSSSPSAKSPSTRELSRIQRAVLRIEAFTYIFSLEDEYSLRSKYRHPEDLNGPFRRQGYNRIHRHDWVRRHHSLCLSDEQQVLFLNRYEEWEIEEMICVRDWYRREYDALYKQYPKEWKDVWIYQEWIDGDPSLTFEEVSHSKYVRVKYWRDWENISELCMRKGFELLAEVKRKETGKEKVNVIFSAIDSNAIYFIDVDDFLSMTLEDWQIMRTEDATGKDIYIQTLQNYLEGQAAWDESGYNAAWCWVRRQWERDDEKWDQTGNCLRSWGYVMWDAWRLDALGILSCDVDELEMHGPKKFGGHLLSEYVIGRDDD
ncbi:hypothetical protein BOTCAL_0488g00040 [Botryotinia calthae]|uniref:Uncharacterized protein n=1 Tax=Botryotinia calthae TaxID=38488 RepID=A0A4Y8CLR0_9HELO|nr:hypothetical protein BOTCAL_0488g00040 [Botryotinia calthae]